MVKKWGFSSKHTVHITATIVHKKKVIENYIKVNVSHISYWEKLLKEPLWLEEWEQTRSLHLCASTQQCSKVLENTADTAPSLRRCPLFSWKGYCVPGSITRNAAGTGPLPAEFAAGALSEVKKEAMISVCPGWPAQKAGVWTSDITPITF